VSTNVPPFALTTLTFCTSSRAVRPLPFTVSDVAIAGLTVWSNVIV